MLSAGVARAAGQPLDDRHPGGCHDPSGRATWLPAIRWV
jgi:hypothetical protein